MNTTEPTLSIKECALDLSEKINPKTGLPKTYFTVRRWFLEWLKKGRTLLNLGNGRNKFWHIRKSDWLIMRREHEVRGL
jgi:hypothetical protein